MPLTRKSLIQPSRPTRSQGPAPTQVATPRGRGQKISVKETPKATNVRPGRKAVLPDKADVSSTRSRSKLDADAVTVSKDPEVQTKPASDKDETKETNKGASSEVSAPVRLAQKRSAESQGNTDSGKKPKTTAGKAMGAAVGETTPADTFSPRRSSRAVVPNSRFKDMEMLGTGKKKSAAKEKEKTKAEPKKEQKGVKVDFTKINVQLQPETPTVIEEVVTEETQIDTLAQMNMFDEILILPHTSAAARPVVSNSHMTPEVSLPPAISFETSVVRSTNECKLSDQLITSVYEDASSANGESKMTVTACETSTIPVETNVISSGTDMKMGSTVFANESMASEIVMTSTDSVVGSLTSSSTEGETSVTTSPSKTVAPQVIVMEGKMTSGSEAKRKVPMLNEQNKNRVIIMGPEDIKRPKPRKILVSPTHVLKGQGPQKLNLGVNANQLRISKGVVETVTKDQANPAQSMLSTTIPVKVKSNLITAGQIIHTPLKNDGDIKSILFQSQTPKKSVRAAETQMKSVPVTIASPGPKPSENIENSGNLVGSKVMGKSAPQINVVYVKAKAKPDTYQEQRRSHLRYEVITAPSSVYNEKSVEEISEGIVENTAISNEEILTTDDNLKTSANTALEMVMEHPVTDLNTMGPQVEEIKTVDHQNEIRYFEEIVNVPGEPEEVLMTSSDKLPEDIKTAVADAESEKPMEEYGEGLELANEVQNLPIGTAESKKSVDQKLMSSLCQVIKYDKVKEPETRTQTAIEYVMFDDKMVPIHKPYTASHGRVQVTRAPAVVKRTHGRVESQGQLDKGQVKKIPVSTAQSAISSIIDQIGEDKSSQGLDLGSITIISKSEEDMLGISDSAVTMVDSSGMIQGQEVNINSPQSTRVIHGYIDQPAKQSGEATKVVEISQDLFAKEVYGDSLVLDAVTGEMVPITMVSMENSQVLTDVNSSVVPVVTDDLQTEPKTSQDSDGKVVETTDEGLADWTMNSSASDIDRQASGVEGILGVKPDLASPELTGKDTNVVELQSVDMLGLTSNQTITVEKMASGEEAVVVHINQEDFVKADADTGVAVTKTETAETESGNVIKLRDVKITPCSSYNGVVRPEHMATVARGDFKAEKTDFKTATATMGTSTTEIETQTEDTDEDSDLDEMSLSDEEQLKVRQVVVVTQQSSGDSPLKRTKMTVSEDGQCQEYVVVHLPEGTEIKQAQPRQVVQDPIHDEVVTMSPDGMYICVDCNHKTDKKGNWFKHRRKHLGIRPHACTKCSYRAATSSNLKRHMQIHDDIRNFACATCGLLFRQKIHLERHVKYRHQEKNVKCPLCDYLCASENPDLKIHIRRRHMPQEDGSMSAFTCDECGLMTVSKKDLKQHMKFHKKGPELKLFCEYCSFVTDCESRLRRHVLIHTKERPFQCGLCAYRATQKEHVLRHMRSQHDIEVERKQRKPIMQMKEKPRRSLLEGLHFTSKDASDDSEESEKPFEKSDYSSTDKIFACNHCTMKFSKLINLYKHLYAQHRQVMPDPSSSDFQCVVCEFRTNNKKNLLVHMRKHNMQDHTPPSHVYSCVLCRYINPRRRNLFQHMKKKHGIEIMMKEDGLNCYVTSDNTSLVLGQQEGEASVMALSDIVTTQTVDEDSQLHIVTDDNSAFSAEKISIDNIISVEDIPSYVSMTQEQAMVSLQNSGVSTSQLYQPTVAEHEAAEAIEGLQALAQQAGILETQTIESDINTEIVSSEIMTDGEILATEEVPPLDQGDEGAGIQLSSEQLNQLSSGDFVEINGEVYKVEIAQEGAAK